jgi:adenine phosphoribosyltransferase
MDAVRAAIRDVPDFPKKGILFKDLTPVLANPALFRQVIDGFAARWRDEGIARIVSVESRGFLFGAPLAYAIDAGLGIVRKPGKLPYQTVRESYDLEYGQDSLELHIDAVNPGERVLIVDDLLATGGTAGAAARLVEQQGGTVAGFAFVVELGFLAGRTRLGERAVQSLVTY